MNARVVSTTVIQRRFVPTLEVHLIVAAKKDTLEMVNIVRVRTPLFECSECSDNNII